MRALACVLLLAACGGDDGRGDSPKKAPPRGQGGQAPRVNGPPPAPNVPAATPLSQTAQKLLDEVRKHELANEDFVENDNNRDPFRSYLATFAAQPTLIGKQHKIILQKFALDELKLSAIVSGDAVAPRAMFLDPSGLGISVQRGDHVSKADALVVRIAPDRVFFNIEEDAGSGKTRTQERVIELHAGELAPQ